MQRLVVWLILASAPLLAVDPRKSAADYPARATSPAGSLGAEYVGRFIVQDGESHQTGDYVAIEVGFFPASDELLELRGSDFMLRVNGSRQLVYPQSAGLVAGSIRHPDWEHRRGLEVGGGFGGADVILGRPRQTSRFPGDTTGRTPAPIPTEPDSQGVSDPAKDPLEMAARAINAQALGEGPARGSRAGYIYFIYKKKLATLKSLELVWVSGGERRTLTLK